MRKILVLCLLFAIAIPAAAASTRTPPLPPGGNGTLSIREGRGVLQLNAHGSMTGRLNGRLTITDPKPYDSKRPIVYGATKTIYRNAKTTVFQGKNVRFRLIGAQFQIRAEGKAIFVSALGRGRGVLDGAGDPAANIFFDGVWSLNEEPPHSLPDVATAFELVASPSG
jgi:acid phosphatase class B